MTATEADQVAAARRYIDRAHKGGDARSRLLILIDVLGREQAIAVLPLLFEADLRNGRAKLHVGEGDPLTARELQIIRCAAEGLNRRETADQLFLSVGTVHTYRKRVLEKLGAKTMAHAVALGYQRGLLP